MTETIKSKDEKPFDLKNYGNLYIVKVMGLPWQENLVMADNHNEAYEKVKKFLISQNTYSPSEIELKSIELVEGDYNDKLKQRLILL